jgi:hypothetical protein
VGFARASHIFLLTFLPPPHTMYQLHGPAVYFFQIFFWNGGQVCFI